MESKDILPEDRHFCKKAVERGVITEEQADEYLNELARLASQDDFPGADSLLLRDGVISQDQAQEIMKALHEMRTSGILEMAPVDDFSIDDMKPEEESPPEKPPTEAAETEAPLEELAPVDMPDAFVPAPGSTPAETPSAQGPPPETSAPEAPSEPAPQAETPAPQAPPEPAPQAEAPAPDTPPEPAPQAEAPAPDSPPEPAPPAPTSAMAETIAAPPPDTAPAEAPASPAPEGGEAPSAQVEEKEEDKAAQREARRKAARERLHQRRKSGPLPKVKRRNPFLIVGTVAVVLAAAGLGVFFIFFAPKGESLGKVLKKAKAAEQQKQWADALKILDSFLEGGPSEDEALQARTERERMAKEVEVIVDRLAKECREGLEKGDTFAMQDALEKGDMYLKLAPLVGKESPELKETLTAARTEWDTLQNAQKSSEDAFAAGKVVGALQVPRGKYILNQTLEVTEGAALTIRDGVKVRFLEDKNLVIRKGGKVTVGSGALLEFEGSSEIAVNEGGAIHFQAGAEVQFGPESGLTAMGKVTAEGTKEKPVLIHPRQKAGEASEGFFNLLFDGKGTVDSSLKYVNVEGGQGRTIPNITERAETYGGAFAFIKGAKARLEDVKVIYCNAGGGGAVFVMESEVELIRCILDTNKGSFWGGGIFAYRGAVVSITDGEIRSNEAFQVG
ncbi:MAG: hypothetical protein ACYTHN_10065, partial [Planctomycetota bacterium]